MTPAQHFAYFNRIASGDRGAVPEVEVPREDTQPMEVDEYFEDPEKTEEIPGHVVQQLLAGTRHRYAPAFERWGWNQLPEFIRWCHEKGVAP